MKPHTFLFVAVLLLSASPGCSSRARAAPKTRVLLVTGGHDYATNQFLAVFRADTNITFQCVAHPHADAWLDPEPARRFDVLVLYDLWQPITDAAKSNLLKWLKAGKGLVALHHSLANYQAWPEYARIIGGKYYLEKTTVNGVEKPQSTYLHDVHVHVHVADPEHPVTRGVHDFDIVDETYGAFEVDPRVHSLLTTDAKTSSPTIAWAHRYGKARVVYLQLGHGPTAYQNPNYRRLVAQAIRWAAGRR